MKAKKTEQIPDAETKFNITLGGKVYTLSFGTSTFIRIREARPSLTTAFHVMDEMTGMEAIPFLINCAIRPENRDWSSYEDFLELYDDCEDSEAIPKVVPAYFGALGRLIKKIEPALVAIEKNQKIAK